MNLKDETHPKLSVVINPPSPPEEIEIDFIGSPKINPLAFYGPLKHIVEKTTANTEAVPVSVAANVIAYLSAIVGNKIFNRIGDSKQYGRPFFLIVGDSSKARKGTSWQPVKKLFDRVEHLLLESNSHHNPLKVHSGCLSSGEGIAYALRDPSEELNKDGEPLESGVEDKRLLVIEEEFANVLEHSKRQGNTLSSTVRRLFDGVDLAPLTKRDRTRASNPHVSIVGHITSTELLSKVSTNDVMNGFLNRFILLSVKREKYVAQPLPTPNEEIEYLARSLTNIIQPVLNFSDEMEIIFTDSAAILWEETYPKLQKNSCTTSAALAARSDAYCRMLAMIFAVMEGEPFQIKPEHIRASLYWIEYWEESTKYIFKLGLEEIQQSKTEELAEKIYEYIRTNPGVSKTIISTGLFSKNKSSIEISSALKWLTEQTPQKISISKNNQNGIKGRPIERFYCSE